LPAGLSGQGLAYRLVITSDHPPGTYWYHPHHHHSTHPQVAGGAMGVLIIDEIGKNGVISPSIPPSVFTNNYKTWSITNEKILFFVYAGMSSGIPLLNGVDIKTTAPRQSVSVLADQWYRFRVAVTSVFGVSTNLTFSSKCTAMQVAQDGLWLSTVPWPAASSFGFSGASRIDIAVKCSAGNSTIKWGKITDSTRYTVDIVATSPKNNSGSPFAADGISTWNPIRPAHMPNMSKVVPKEFWEVQGQVNGIKFNTKSWSLQEAARLFYNETYEFRLVPNSSEIAVNNIHDHPLHLHVFPMQVVGIIENGVVVPKDCPGETDSSGNVFSYKLYEFYDTIKPRARSDPKTCVVRFRTLGYSGKVLFHCHMLLHEDEGAMAWVYVEGDNDIIVTNPDMNLITIPAISPILSK